MPRKPGVRGGLPFEALFYRQLQQVTTRIHDTEDVEQIMLEVSPEICRLFNADRLTLYALAEDLSAIVSKVKTGLASARALRLPVGPQSIAGYVAMSRHALNLPDVHDRAALRRIHPQLKFLDEVDRRSGYKTRQMMALPIIEGETLYGVLQIINSLDGRPFSALEFEGAVQLCRTLATALRQRMHKAAVHSLRRPTRYDGLLADGVIDAQDLHRAMELAREDGRPVEQVLLTDFRIRAAQIGASLSRYFGVPYEPHLRARIRSETLHGVLRREFVVEHGWIPLEDSPDGLLVMCRDPEVVRGSRIVPQVFPRAARIAWRVTTETEFEQTLQQLYGDDERARVDNMLGDIGPPLDDENGGELESAAADNELVKFVNKVVVDAYEQRASDIHIEPLPGRGRTGIRFRIDGVLQPYTEVPAHFRRALVTRLKIMCDLDISERRRPQDGKIRFRKFGPLDIELRVATLPTAGDVEDVVIRLLAAGEPLPLDQLEIGAHTLQALQAAIAKPYGLFYVCGPTGSGKTTTLHAILRHLNTPEVKIWTAEDPVEITQKGLRQVQVNKKAGLDFAILMRAFLRADPDIIMVGESRDAETVGMSVEASLTGHLVFSTLHTNSAPESIVRLLDMGMDPFNFADALLGILAQRLARRLCECKEAYLPGEEEVQALVGEYAEELRATPAWQADPAGEVQRLREAWLREWGHDGQLRLYRAKGCERCHGTGYRGRVGLHELLVPDAQVKRLIQQRASVGEIFAACVGRGMRSLKMDGVEKVLLGVTDLSQVRAVCLR
ncbi:GspE/PulE family protein [Ramlibacter rhizophilus]|uniref:GspE/PulE family protein n=1 Tax=Ramlibacter rhizophilus TaxID=1781167 RepID=UPI001F110F2C|nr:GspE/PulE family protein [Ramlibacter rhizophilus]